MEDVKAMIDVLVEILQIPFTIWGFTLSFWEIMLALIIGSIVIGLVWGFLTE